MKPVQVAGVFLLLATWVAYSGAVIHLVRKNIQRTTCRSTQFYVMCGVCMAAICCAVGALLVAGLSQAQTWICSGVILAATVGLGVSTTG